LALISQAPRIFIVLSFSRVSPLAGGTALAIELATTILPFVVAQRYEKRSSIIRSHPIVSDRSIAVATTLLATSIYSLAVYSKLLISLPTLLLTYFWGLENTRIAHAANLAALFVAFLPLGFAAHQFIFVPSARDTGVPATQFDPKAATLGETLWYNIWSGFSKKTRVTISRSAIFIAVGWLSTYIQTLTTLQEADPLLIREWATTWSSASAFVGFMFWWIMHI
jgi:hypothetical protein